MVIKYTGTDRSCKNFISECPKCPIPLQDVYVVSPYTCIYVCSDAIWLKVSGHLTITKLEAQSSVECLCMLYYYNFLLLKPCAHSELHELKL